MPIRLRTWSTTSTTGPQVRLSQNFGVAEHEHERGAIGDRVGHRMTEQPDVGRRARRERREDRRRSRRSSASATETPSRPRPAPSAPRRPRGRARPGSAARRPAPRRARTSRPPGAGSARRKHARHVTGRGLRDARARRRSPAAPSSGETACRRASGRPTPARCGRSIELLTRVDDEEDDAHGPARVVGRSGNERDVRPRPVQHVTREPAAPGPLPRSGYPRRRHSRGQQRGREEERGREYDTAAHGAECTGGSAELRASRRAGRRRSPAGRSPRSAGRTTSTAIDNQ